jgi:hypothetical protein
MTLMDRQSFVHSLSLPLLAVAALVPALPVFCQAPTDHSPDLEIQYTGRLFGYYRIEPGQPPPPLNPIVVQSPMPAALMQREIPLLGMGDTFGPEFGASIQPEFLNLEDPQTPTPPGNWSPCVDKVDKDNLLAPEALYKSSTRMPNLAECDNVTRFLMMSGYRAIVPGREDFLYSATWLRRIAVLLHGASNDPEENRPTNPFPKENPTKTWTAAPAPIRNSEGKLVMLGANLRVKVSTQSCPLLFSYNLLSSVHPCKDESDGITAEMDWFRRLQETLSAYTTEDTSVINNSGDIEDAINRRASGDAVYRLQLVTNEFSILQTLLAAYQCPKDQPRSNDQPQTLSTLIGELADKNSYTVDPDATLHLKPGSNADQYWSAAQKDPSRLNVNCIGPEDGNGQLIPLSEDTLSSTEAASDIKSLILGATDSLNLALASTATLPRGPILVTKEVRQTALSLFLNLIYIEQRNIGYTIARLPKNKYALIIGVAGQETMQQISKTNFSVEADKQDHQERPASKTSADPSPSAQPPNPAPQMTSQSAKAKREYEVTTADPRFAVTTVLRAAWAAREIARKRGQSSKDSPQFDSVIVMAQMPPAEALELAAHVRSDMTAAFYKSGQTPPSIDLVLSEAMSGRESLNRAIEVNPGDLPPILTPLDSSVTSSHAIANVSKAQIFNTPSAFELHLSGPPELSRLVLNLQSSDPQNVVANSSAPAVQQNSALSNSQASPNSTQQNQACDVTIQTKDLPENAACYLKIELDHVKTPRHTSGEKDLDALWDACETTTAPGKTHVDRSCQNNVLMQQLLHLLERGSHADVSFLERRDFYFGALEDGYRDYSICDNWFKDHKAKDPKQFSDTPQYCRLRVALDRVLWKGDFSQRVMVNGVTLKEMLQTAKQQTDQEQTLLAGDVHDAWLTTYGIVTAPSLNLVTSTSSVYSFSVPGIGQCNFAGTPSPNADPSTAPAVAYCINGAAILDDHAYSLITSDYLAADQSIYKSSLGTFTQQNPHYEDRPQKTFLSAEIAKQAIAEGLPSVLRAAEKAPIANHHYRVPPETNLARVETDHQNRSLVQLDFSKLVAGFTFFHPSLSDSALATDLTGVANTQAITPHSQELDLESASRLTFSLPWSNYPNTSAIAKALTFGLQGDAEYDRKALGNLTGNPETVTYSLNSFTSGGFVQVPTDFGIAPHPHAFIVLAPAQYQRQMTGAHLNFSFLSAAGVANSQEQLSVHAPEVWGFNHRIGFRYQFERTRKSTPDPGSYGEVGPEYSDQNNILKALLLPQISPTTVCSFVATQSIQTCVKNAYKAAGTALNGSSVLVPVPQTIHAGGIYWTIHLVKTIPMSKGAKVTFDTQGDSFLLPGAALTTQERYGITTNLAINFPIVGNITLSPTYTDFFFENQGEPSKRTSLAAPAYTVVLKWYFVRDSAVPFRRQWFFTGPGTADQTSTSKLK